jgi:Flp pilus assembly protein TadG
MAKRRQKGQTTLEFALIGTLFFMLLFGVFEVARFTYGVNAVANAARDGARWTVAVANIPSGQSTACNSSLGGLQDAARQATGGLPSVTITAQEDASTPPAWCTVTVTWAFTPAIGTGMFKPYAVTSSSRQYYN